MPSPLCFQVCAHYRDEVSAVLAQTGWADVRLQTHAPLCLASPAPSSPHPASPPSPATGCSQVCLLSGCLPIRAAKSPSPDEQLHAVDQCFHLLAPAAWIDQLTQDGAYLVSPGWLRHWREHLAHWGFDQATAQTFFHESVRQITLLDTGLDPASPTQAQWLADYLRLPLQIWRVGLSHLQYIMQTRYQEWRAVQAQAAAARETADYALAFDWLPRLTAPKTEQEVAEELAQFSAMLFAARQISYAPLGLAPGEPGPNLPTPSLAPGVLDTWLATDEPHLWTTDGQGFLVRLTYQAETVGVIEIGELAFPEHREHYLKLLLALAPVGGLAIANARAYQALQHLNTELEHRVAQRTAELRDSNTALTRALAVKSEFMAAMSHELRSPLAGVLGLTDTLQMGAYGLITERQQQPLNLLRANAQRLLNLVTDVLDYTALESGHTPLNLTDVAVSEVGLASLKTIQAAARAKQIKISFSSDTEQLQVWADRGRLEQILAKLLDNAVKFTPAGGKAGLEAAREPGSPEVSLTVWDTGCGIPLEAQARIFEPFEQADRRLARTHEGAGLGLALVRRLVELHQGRVTVTSAGPGQGSRFTVTLPAAHPRP